MKVALGADHRGHSAATSAADYLTSNGHDVSILGDCEGRPCDYPDQAYLVAQSVSKGESERGILVCGSGIGVAIAANKVKGIRAGVVLDEDAAVLSRQHNNTNVLCLSADATNPEVMKRLIDIWLTTEFEGGRHERRVRKIEAIERGEDPASIPADSPAVAEK